MKCNYIPLLWKKIFLNFANNRDYIFIYRNRPPNKFHKLCREWYLNQNSDDNETRALDDDLNNMLNAYFGNFLGW